MSQQDASMLRELTVVRDPEVIDVEWRVVPKEAGTVRALLASLARRAEEALAFSLIVLFCVLWIAGVAFAAFGLYVSMR